MLSGNFHTHLGCIDKSRTETSQMVKGGRKSTVRGAPYESTSIAAVYGTICSLVWEPWGQP